MINRKKVYTLLPCTLLLILIISNPVYATAYGQGSDATVDILGGDRFSGAVQFVNYIGKFVDNGFMAFISFVSFFIISAACLRNVLAGAYCVFPKFWDKVHEAHLASEGISFASVQSYFSGGQWKNTSSGTISQFFMRMLLDIKVLTDFETEQDVDYKQYFMRAIPQCILAVFIGVFIYNGYYRDVMIVTSQFGSKVTLNALYSVKPDDILYKLTNISGTPSYPIENAKEGTDYIAVTFMKQTIGNIGKEYSDQAEKNNKEQMWNSMSDWCSKYFAANFKEFSDTTIWSPSVKGDGIRKTPPTSNTDGYSADGLTYSKLVVIPISELGLNTEFHKGEDWYLYGTIVMSNKGASSKLSDIEIDDFILTIPYPSGMTVNAGTGTGGAIKTGGNITVGGNKVEVGQGGALIFKSISGFTKGEIAVADDLWYASNSPSKNFKIIGVNFKDGATPTLTSNKTSITIKVGGDIGAEWRKKKNGVHTTTPTEAPTGSADLEELEDGADG